MPARRRCIRRSPWSRGASYDRPDLSAGPKRRLFCPGTRVSVFPGVQPSDSGALPRGRNCQAMETSPPSFPVISTGTSSLRKKSQGGTGEEAVPGCPARRISPVGGGGVERKGTGLDRGEVSGGVLRPHPQGIHAVPRKGEDGFGRERQCRGGDGAGIKLYIYRKRSWVAGRLRRGNGGGGIGDIPAVIPVRLFGASTSAAGGGGVFCIFTSIGGEASPAVPASLTARKR